MKRSKKYTEALKKFDKTKSYSVEEATKLVKETATAKFDETVELVVRLNIDSKKADQQLRGAIVLPNGTGKTKKVLVIAKGAAAKAATEAGADYVGDVDMIDKIAKENWFDFDVLVATPDMMPALGKIGKVLGPKGLMPNPKTGTVTMDTAKAVEEVKKGRTEYRTDMYGNVAIVVGKVSFTAKKLAENVQTFIDMLEKGRPSTVKGNYIESTTISCTMGPGIKIDTKAFDTTEE
jgi:large subunit ribosomal protein L1